MTPKEKAKELIDKYIPLTLRFHAEYGWDEDVDSAKECALIAVNVALEALDEHQWQNQHVIAEYNQIKKEIENYG